MTPNSNHPDEKRAEDFLKTFYGTAYKFLKPHEVKLNVSMMEEYATLKLHAKSEECERLTRENERMFELLYDYEQWEADIISCDEMWAGSTSNRDALPLPIYEQMLVLQRKRNEILHPTK